MRSPGVASDQVSSTRSSRPDRPVDVGRGALGDLGDDVAVGGATICRLLASEASTRSPPTYP